MNFTVFLKWLEEKVFPKMKSHGHKCVLVIDRAKYHTMLTEETRPPTTQWNKSLLAGFIVKWGTPVPGDWPLIWKRKKTRRQLLECARQVKPNPKYLVQELADKFTDGAFIIKIIFLPVAHPELNPMEMAWGTVKRAVATANVTFSLSEVEIMTLD